MTYQQLLIKLCQLSQEQLQQEVLVYLEGQDVSYPVSEIIEINVDGDNQVFLSVD